MAKPDANKEQKKYKKGTFMALGIAFGSMFGVVFDNPGVGIALGLVLGNALDAHYQKRIK